MYVNPIATEPQSFLTNIGSPWAFPSATATSHASADPARSLANRMCLPSGAQPRTLWFDRSAMRSDSVPVWSSKSENPCLVAQAMYRPSGENAPPGDKPSPVAFSSFAEPSANATSIMSIVPSAFPNSTSRCRPSGDHASGRRLGIPASAARRTLAFEPSNPTTQRLNQPPEFQA